MGKTKVRKTEARITDIISLFEYLQTTRNYAIFNNLLNVMLSFIIKDDKITNEISKLYTLYKNKDLLKELYTNIKNGHRVKVSHPKSSSSSHFGSIGSPPKS